MPVGIKNPFRRVGIVTQQGHAKPMHSGVNGDSGGKVSAISTGQPGTDGKSLEDAEYKLSVVNDSGEYLPPSPPEDKPFWGSRRSNKSSSSRTALNDEHFSISRESFDGYRRSFDISATSPVIQPTLPSRMSLDSRVTPSSNKSAGKQRISSAPQPQHEQEQQHDDFEDVELEDDESRRKKRNIFSRLTGSGGSSSNVTTKIKKEDSEAELRRL